MEQTGFAWIACRNCGTPVDQPEGSVQRYCERCARTLEESELYEEEDEPTLDLSQP